MRARLAREHTNYYHRSGPRTTPQTGADVQTPPRAGREGYPSHTRPLAIVGSATARQSTNGSGRSRPSRGSWSNTMAPSVTCARRRNALGASPRSRRGLGWNTTMVNPGDARPGWWCRSCGRLRRKKRGGRPRVLDRPPPGGARPEHAMAAEGCKGRSVALQPRQCAAAESPNHLRMTARPHAQNEDVREKGRAARDDTARRYRMPPVVEVRPPAPAGWPRETIGIISSRGKNPPMGRRRHQQTCREP